MSTTPPKKGKKRQAPQTPSGKPPVKASRASTPNPAQTESVLLSPTLGVLPAIPPFRPSAGSSRSPPTPRGGSPTPMATDEASLPTVFHIPHMEAVLDDEEAEKLFKELQDWVKYIAQHQGQQRRLLQLTTVVVNSLKDLLGEPEEAKLTSYAAAAATSALRPSFPKQARKTPTSKTIQHAITRFERVSKELPGASRDTLLKVVTSSNLNSAPTPFQSDPKPRKQRSCLVQGIHANTVSMRLPDGVKTPPSIPAVLTDVNGLLNTLELEGRVKEIHLGIRSHLNLVFDQVVKHQTRTAALEFVLGRFHTSSSTTTVLERTTHSILKFTAVPTITNDGRKVTEDLAASFLRKHPAWKEAEFLEKPRFVFPKRNPDPLCATLQVKVNDTRKATIAKKLLETTVSFAGVVRRCQQWSVAPTARQCSTCLKWGHTAYICRARSPQCDQCASQHSTAYHAQHASNCKDQRVMI